MKDSIVLQGREFHITHLITQEFGMDHKTLTKLVKAKVLPAPVRIGNRSYYDRKAIENGILATAQA